MNPAVCYHRFELCVDAESANDCSVHLVGCTIFAKFVSNLICQVFISTVLTILTSKQSFGAPALSIIFFPSQGILSFSCLQTVSIFSEVRLCLSTVKSRKKKEIHRWRYVFNYLWPLPFGLAIDICCVTPVLDSAVCYHRHWCCTCVLCSSIIIMLQHRFLCCYSVSQW